MQCPDRYTTDIIYSSLSNTPQQSKFQPVSPAHRLPAYSDTCLSPSLCVVRADYKLARKFPPELYNTGTELEQRSPQYRSQISYWSRSKLYRIREISKYHLELVNLLFFGAIYTGTYIIGCPLGCCCLCIVNILITINYYSTIPSFRNKHNNSWSVVWLFQTTSNRLY